MDYLNQMIDENEDIVYRNRINSPSFGRVFPTTQSQGPAGPSSSSNRRNPEERPIHSAENRDIPLNAQQEWDLNEALRASISEKQRNQNSRNPRSSRYRHEDDEDEEDVPQAKWNKLEADLKELSIFLKNQQAEKALETRPDKKYRNLVESEKSIKIFSKKDSGYRILQEQRSEKEQLEIDFSNFEMLKFAFSRHPEVLNMDWNPMEVQIFYKIDRFIGDNEETAFRQGALSVAMDFENFPPNLTWRGRGNEGLVMLRPVVIDGVAVLNATLPDDSPQPFYGIAPEMPIYQEILNLPVKAVFDVIMNFVIRGHKTCVFLPKYYKNYITPGRISKVDDLVAFRKLIDLGLIKFLENREGRESWNWFLEISRIVDQTGSVFVSSLDYRRKPEDQKYEKPSDRIIQPIFWNTFDRVMVLEPSIRYKDENDNSFRTITAEQVLQFAEPDDERAQLGEQLYLDKQIELICHLCQLYPTKSMHKVSIQQLLHLVVRANSNFDMPGMNLETYLGMCERFGNHQNDAEDFVDDNNSNV
ncbi:hypothetical protein L3Y34_016627 [Caenorhabditis briggsae]|uniref:Zc3h12a-like Ribonuclease NYN domain-containing protein n=1 Tax=Caenorhabditis briggsae TaxID=6238 RepID=A0AAE9DY61_CAEBR|nr:hypothetical protein L3Y34_016627 [Caenorhabditis briggsae]